MRKVLTFAAVAEAATGVALIVVPSLVVRLLFGADIAGASVVMSRITDGMGLGAGEVELDGRRGRSFRLSSDGTGIAWLDGLSHGKRFISLGSLAKYP